MATLIQDPEAERLFLACIAADPPLAMLYAQSLTEDDMADVRHKLLWEGYLSFLIQRRTADIDVMQVWLESRPHGSQTALDIVSPEYLRKVYDTNTLLGHDPPILDTKKAEFFATRILDASDRTLRAEIAESLAEASQVRGVDGDALWSEVLGQVTERRRAKSHVRQIAEYYPRIQDSVEGWFRGERGALCSTGYPSLDRLLGGGLQPKRLLVIGGAPGTGKTTLLLNIMAEMGNAGDPTGMSSVEMAGEDLAVLLTCRNIGISYTALRSLDYATVGDHLKSFERAKNKRIEEKFYAELKRISTLPILCDDRHAGMTAAKIYTTVLLTALQHDVKLWGIDYAEILAGDGSNAENEALRIGEIFKASKNMARLLGITTALLSQITKDVKNRPDGKPMMDDIKFAPPAVPDTIWLTWYPGGRAQVGDVRPAYVKKQYASLGITCEPDELIIIQAKARHGQVQMIKLEFQPATGRLIDPHAHFAVTLAKEAF